MMRFEKCDASPAFFRVRGLNADLVQYLKYSVKQTFRYYENGAWYVHQTQVLGLTQLGYGFYGHVDYSELPDDLQIRIAQEKVSWKKGTYRPKGMKIAGSIDKSTLYASLYLTPEAPPEVVKAAYRALAKKHHPDHGGDAEEFKKIQEAYNKLSG